MQTATTETTMPSAQPPTELTVNQLVHPQARVHPEATLGSYVEIEAGAQVGARSVVDDYCRRAAP